MALTILNTYSAVGGTPYSLVTGDTLLVTGAGTLVPTNTTAVGVSANGDDISVVVDGAIYAVNTNSTAIAFSMTSSEGSVRVGAEGIVQGANTGIRFYGTSTLDNAGSVWGNKGVTMVRGTVNNGGSITGELYGVEATADGVALRNTGLITGGSSAVQLNSVGANGDGVTTLVNEGSILGGSSEVGKGAVVGGSAAMLVNTGTITGYTAVSLWAGIDASLPGITLVNSGTIATTDSGTGGAAVTASALADTVVNAGDMTGKVSLGNGDDLFDGIQGRQLRGAVLGGDGDDTVLGGAAGERLEGNAGDDSIEAGDGDDIVLGGAGADVLDGGAGLRDRLDYFGSTAVDVDLALGEGSGGHAAGDVFTGFEQLGGSGFGDTLAGDAQANALFGRAGNDLLVGGAGSDLLVGDIGNDTLNGGTGVDVLRGGIGADVFRFVTSADSGAAGAPRDRIADFAKAQLDRIDLSFIDANATLGGNQAFDFIGAAGFSAAGQVRAQVINGNTFVFGNTDANFATSEFSIALTGSVALAAGDFVL